MPDRRAEPLAKLLHWGNRVARSCQAANTPKGVGVGTLGPLAWRKEPLLAEGRLRSIT